MSFVFRRMNSTAQVGAQTSRDPGRVRKFDLSFKLGRILMEHIDRNCSLIYKLHFEYLGSVEIYPLLKVIDLLNKATQGHWC